MVVTRERPARPGPVWARWLLLVSLLFGVAAMHTLGHPSEGADGAAPAAAHLVGPASAGHAAPEQAAHTDAHAPAMDATSMCLAVAGMAAALVGLAASVFTPWPGPLPRPSSPLRRLLLPVAPPRPPSLAKLQVMRV